MPDKKTTRLRRFSKSSARLTTHCNARRGQPTINGPDALSCPTLAPLNAMFAVVRAVSPQIHGPPKVQMGHYERLSCASTPKRCATEIGPEGAIWQHEAQTKQQLIQNAMEVWRHMTRPWRHPHHPLRPRPDFPCGSNGRQLLLRRHPDGTNVNVCTVAQPQNKSKRKQRSLKHFEHEVADAYPENVYNGSASIQKPVNRKQQRNVTQR